jgi:hypothetical protein
LARLPPHHAYLKLPDGTVTQEPVWLEARFHDYQPPPPSVEVDDLAEAAAKLRAEDARQKSVGAHPAQLLAHMHSRGHRLMLTPAVVAAAWQLCAVPGHSRLLERAAKYDIPGCDGLPTCWLVGFLSWLGRHPGPRRGIRAVAVESSMLWPTLDPLVPWSLAAHVPEAVNLAMYPSLWRPLQKRHWTRLMRERPDLRQELLGLPQAQPQESAEDGV